MKYKKKTLSESKLSGSALEMVYTANACQISWKGYDFFTKIKHFRTFIEQITFISNHYMDMTIALKSLNEMQQTVNMRLTIIPHDITYTLLRSQTCYESILSVSCKLSYIRFFCFLYRNDFFWE